MNKGLVLLLILVLADLSFASRLKAKRTVVTYKIPYYGLCAKTSCRKPYHCTQGKCITYTEGKAGSYCNWKSFKFCGKNLECQSKVCVKSGKDYIFKFTKAKSFKA